MNSGEMPIGWRAAGGVYRLQYAHPLLENSLVSAVAVPMGQTLVINGAFICIRAAAVVRLASFELIECLCVCCETAVLKMDKTMENSRKLVLKPDDYVTADGAGNCISILKLYKLY